MRAPGAGSKVHGAFLALGCALLAACGYSTGMQVTERHGTLGLEYFGNESFERDIERELYNEISRVLRDDSDAKLLDPRTADSVIRGTVISYHRRSGIRSPDNELLETGIYLSAEARLVDRKSGLTLRGPSRGDAAVGYNLSESGNEQEARVRALRRVAEELVLELLRPLD